MPKSSTVCTWPSYGHIESCGQRMQLCNASLRQSVSWWIKFAGHATLVALHTAGAHLCHPLHEQAHQLVHEDAATGEGVHPHLLWPRLPLLLLHIQDDDPDDDPENDATTRRSIHAHRPCRYRPALVFGNAPGRQSIFVQTPMLCCNAAGDVHAMLSCLLKHDVVGVLALVPHSELRSAQTACKQLRARIRTVLIRTL